MALRTGKTIHIDREDGVVGIAIYDKSNNAVNKFIGVSEDVGIFIHSGTISRIDNAYKESVALPIVLKNQYSGKCIVCGLGCSVLEYPASIFYDHFVIGVNNLDEKRKVNVIYDIEHRRGSVNWKHPHALWVSINGYSCKQADKEFEYSTEFNIESDKIAVVEHGSSCIGALWLAAYMGFTEIYLLGFDFKRGKDNQGYFWNRVDYVHYDWYNNEKDIRRGEMIKAIEHAVLKLKEKNINVYKAGEYSALDIEYKRI